MFFKKAVNLLEIVHYLMEKTVASKLISGEEESLYTELIDACKMLDFSSERGRVSWDENNRGSEVRRLRALQNKNGREGIYLHRSPEEEETIFMRARQFNHENLEKITNETGTDLRRQVPLKHQNVWTSMEDLKNYSSTKMDFRSPRTDTDMTKELSDVAMNSRSTKVDELENGNWRRKRDDRVPVGKNDCASQYWRCKSSQNLTEEDKEVDWRTRNERHQRSKENVVLDVNRNWRNRPQEKKRQNEDYQERKWNWRERKQN